ncbi:hypothetical protein HO173_001902 [Letharia columbiana]|uniref:Uncharacterized protein n=1 Tax=Letharia columbiana TaxID=112416 RepID=A0A8H6G4D5_9LECA|nr:uncharacterized protein HO173_001902 [Letharia columbiana]KAF6240291.1 hypothetical protein HO173_001902 [Letharia columbiana]
MFVHLRRGLDAPHTFGRGGALSNELDQMDAHALILAIDGLLSVILDAYSSFNGITPEHAIAYQAARDDMVHDPPGKWEKSSTDDDDEKYLKAGSSWTHLTPEDITSLRGPHTPHPPAPAPA